MNRGAGSAAVKAIILPSGDQAKLSTALSQSVRRCASPPSGRMTKIWFLPLRALVKARRVPSGDQRGFEAPLSPRVN